MKLINRDELLTTLEQDIDVSVTGRRNAEEVKRVLQTIYDDIKESPVMDAMPVIRCKDCRYHKGYNCERLYGMQDVFTLSDDDYCSRAERKEE